VQSLKPGSPIGRAVRGEAPDGEGILSPDKSRMCSRVWGIRARGEPYLLLRYSVGVMPTSRVKMRVK